MTVKHKRTPEEIKAGNAVNVATWRAKVKAALLEIGVSSEAKLAGIMADMSAADLEKFRKLIEKYIKTQPPRSLRPRGS